MSHYEVDDILDHIFIGGLTVGLYVSKCHTVKQINEEVKEYRNWRIPLVYPYGLQGDCGKAEGLVDVSQGVVWPWKKDVFWKSHFQV